MTQSVFEKLCEEKCSSVNKNHAEAEGQGQGRTYREKETQNVNILLLQPTVSVGLEREPQKFEWSNQHIYGVPTKPVGLFSCMVMNVCPEVTETDTEATNVKN